MKLIFAAAFASLLLAGCSSTPSDLESKAAPAVQTYTENYQEIFRRVSTTAKRCEAGNVNATASMAVDAQLYSELGYGEISRSLINYGARNYYWTAKIERAGTGSKMTITAGNTINNQSMINNVIRWASGDQNCTAAPVPGAR